MISDNSAIQAPSDPYFSHSNIMSHPASSSTQGNNFAAELAAATNRKQSNHTIAATPSNTSQDDLKEHALKLDPAQQYQDWLKTEPRYLILKGPRPFEQLLPENQQFIMQLREKQKGASMQEKNRIDKQISNLSRFGDEEVFTSESEVTARSRSDQIFISLIAAHLEIYNEKLAPPPGVKPSILKEAEDLIETEETRRESMIQEGLKKGYSRDEILDRFREIDLMSKQNLESFFFGWLDGTRTLETDLALLQKQQN